MTNVSSSNGLEKCPKLRFPGFKESWSDSLLCDLAQIVKGQQLNPDSVDDEGLFYHLNGGIQPSSRTNSWNTQGNTISISEGGNSCGYVKWNSQPFFSGGHNYTLQKVSSVMVSYFLFQMLKSKQDRIMALRVGSGLPNIQKKDVEHFPVCYPSYDEQQKIAEFFRLLDNRIEKQHQIVGMLKKYKRGVIRTLLRPDLCKLKDVKWKFAKIGDLGSFTKGAPLSKADISNEGTPFILYGELYTTYNEVITKVVRKTQATVDRPYYSRIGDVLIPTSGETPEEISTASCVMLPDVILAGDLNIFRCSKIDGRVMSYILNHIVNGNIARVAQGKSVVHIQANEIGKIEIYYPDSVSQGKMIAVFDDINTRIDICIRELALLQSIRQALLQQLFI